MTEKKGRIAGQLYDPNDAAPPVPAIGAGSAVTKDIPAGIAEAGIPRKGIRRP